jgi:hypothetical protein
MASRTSYSLGLIAIVLLVIALLVVGSLSFLVGGIVGQEQLYQSWRQRKLDKLAIILQAPEYRGVRAEHSSADQVYLSGTLATPAARDNLLAQLVEAFGRDEAKAMLSLVEESTSTSGE